MVNISKPRLFKVVFMHTISHCCPSHVKLSILHPDQTGIHGPEWKYERSRTKENRSAFSPFCQMLSEWKTSSKKTTECRKKWKKPQISKESKNKVAHGLVQSLNSPFFPPPYRVWTRADEKRVQDNLHAHAQSAVIFLLNRGKPIFGSTFQIRLVARFSE